MTQRISKQQHRQLWWALYSFLMPADEERFLLKYEGPALVDHTIDVTDLAPALLGLSELIDEANHVINSDRLPCIGGNRKSLSQTSRKLLSSDALDSTRAI
jgi:hypothetical protein